jgi:hypothetical protein
MDHFASLLSPIEETVSQRWELIEAWEGQAAESSLDRCIPAFEFLIRNNMSASGIRTLPIYRNRCYLAPVLEALNKDFGYTYVAVQIGCFWQGQRGSSTWQSPGPKLLQIGLKVTPL